MIWQAALRKAAGRLDRFGPGTMHFSTIRDSGLENNLWPLCQTAQERPRRELMVDANRRFVRGNVMGDFSSVVRALRTAKAAVVENAKQDMNSMRHLRGR